MTLPARAVAMATGCWDDVWKNDLRYAAVAISAHPLLQDFE
jgi:hypothetical protein